MVCSGALLSQIYPAAFGTPQLLPLSPLAIVSAGFLTGFGTRMGSGCTSGHGVCGIPRRSKRSLAAVLTFMTTGALSSYLTHTIPELQKLFYKENSFIGTVNTYQDLCYYVTPTIIAAVFVATHYNPNFYLYKVVFPEDIKVKVKDDQKPEKFPIISKIVVPFCSALVFGLGLGYGGMCDTERVFRFLNFSGPDGWVSVRLRCRV